MSVKFGQIMVRECVFIYFSGVCIICGFMLIERGACFSWQRVTDGAPLFARSSTSCIRSISKQPLRVA